MEAKVVMRSLSGRKTNGLSMHHCAERVHCASCYCLLATVYYCLIAGNDVAGRTFALRHRASALALDDDEAVLPVLAASQPDWPQTVSTIPSVLPPTVIDPPDSGLPKQVGRCLALLCAPTYLPRLHCDPHSPS